MFKTITSILRFIPTSTKEIIFFGSIFTIFFISSVGISNTIDGPQYFTTEMILQNGNVNLVPAKKYAHFYSANDVSNVGNKIFSVRGYSHSIYTFPLHILARGMEPLVDTNNFPKNISGDKNFKHELLTCSIFALFSILGLFFLFKSIKNSTQLNGLAYLIIIFTAFGTYIWKYSAFYVRQGILVFIFGFTIFAFQKYFSYGKGRLLLFFAIAFHASLYGFDLPGFGAFILSILFVFAAYLISRYFTLKKLRGIGIEFVKILKDNITGTLIFTIVVLINILLNYIFLNSFTYIQTVKLFENNKSFGGLLSFATGTPIFPTIWWILFGGTPLPLESLSHLVINEEFISLFSVRNAMKYNFFGIFFISPFLLYMFLPSFTLISDLKDNTKNTTHTFLAKLFDKRNFTIIFCMVYSLAYFLISVKNFAFYAANSFDIRYFYPIVLFFAYLTAQSLNKLIQLGYNRKLFIFVFIMPGFFSLIIGAIGMTNAYGPYMSEERRIWVEIYDFIKVFSLQKNALLNALFPNRHNAFIPIIITLTIAAFTIFVNRYNSLRKD